jgi:VWFA-related protein
VTVVPRLLLACGVIAGMTLIAPPFDSRDRSVVLAHPSTSLGMTLSLSREQDQAPEQQLPRFRAGANLVRVDAYVSKDDVAVVDLTKDDFTVFEDDRPQQVENFELIEARKPNPQSERTDPTSTRDMLQQVDESARLFTLYFDNLRVSLAGSYRAQKPIIETLDRVIGPDDMVGVMTPQMSPAGITYSRRTSSIERMVSDAWNWGKRDSVVPQSPQEWALKNCFGEKLSLPFILRLREQETLDALDDLVSHLDILRPERKFVFVFTEGWPLYRPNDTLLAVIPTPRQEPLGSDPRTGGVRQPGSADPVSGMSESQETCNRQATMLAYSDNEFKFRELLQRANRANISFYPIDARGLIVFDTGIDLGVPPSADAEVLQNRHDRLREMAAQTDGEVVLNAADVSRAMRKIVADIGSYYLLSYYSTNQKLDGRFRRIRVEVKREGVSVRNRPGYLAPSEAEGRAAGVAINRPGAKPTPPATVTRALDALAPARGNLPARVQAIGARNTIRAIVELDAATMKRPEWTSGGTLKLTFEPERPNGMSAAPAAQTVTMPIDPGQRSVVVNSSESPLAAGRYSVRAELMPRSGRVPLQVTTSATVPADAVEVATGGLALRRGPSTGLLYIATADPRFRRTERLRLEVPLAGEGFTGSGRILTREGGALPLVVTYATRVDDATKQMLGVADVSLAPLAAGEYVLELSLTKGGKAEVVTYGFRLVP